MQQLNAFLEMQVLRQEGHDLACENWEKDEFCILKKEDTHLSERVMPCGYIYNSLEAQRRNVPALARSCTSRNAPSDVLS
jgi:hypothetical protein